MAVRRLAKPTINFQDYISQIQKLQRDSSNLAPLLEKTHSTVTPSLDVDFTPSKVLTAQTGISTNYIKANFKSVLDYKHDKLK